MRKEKMYFHLIKLLICLFMRNKCVDQAALELKDSLASLSDVLKLKV